MSYSRPNIQRLDAYVPGEQPERTDLVKLNTNENPYPPSQAVLDAIRGVVGESLRRYPSPTADKFRHAAAEAHGLAADQVIATNGGDELLRLVITVFCTPQPDAPGGVAVAEPSYSLCPVLADIHDTAVTRVTLPDDWSLPDDFADIALDAGCRLAIVVNPHAPSGRLEPIDRLERIARKLQGKAVLLVDEAYVNFARNDALPLLDPARGLDNVLLLRTLSKGYSLAGLRFGYGMACAGLIAELDKARDSYNTNILGQVAATAAIESRSEAAETWRKVIDQRARVTQELTSLGCDVHPSEANFVLARFPEVGRGEKTGGQSPPLARVVLESFKAKGIFVRYFDQDPLRDKLRITIGTPQQNDALLAAIAQSIAQDAG